MPRLNLIGQLLVVEAGAVQSMAQRRHGSRENMRESTYHSLASMSNCHCNHQVVTPKQ